MNVGILGSGDVAKALAGGFLKHGYNIMLGTRDAAKLSEWQLQHPDARTGSVEDAARFGDIIVLAVKGTIALQVLEAAGEANLAGKLVIDVSNPIADAAPTAGVLSYFTNLEESLMERLQRAYPAAHFVKAFNSVGNAYMVNPDFGGVRPSMFICGNEPSAKQTVCEILDKFGWEPEDMGQCEAARAIEPLCMLWCIPGFLHNDWAHAFKILR